MSDKYKNPKWQKKRLQVLSRDNWKCVACGDAQTTLHVHHKMYRPGEIWDTEDEMMQTLCEPCHKALGDHPKAGVFWVESSDGARVCLAWCPVCAGLRFQETRECLVCCGCSWDTKKYHTVGSSISIASSIKLIPYENNEKPKTHSLAWLKGIVTKVRKGGATDGDIFLAMFPHSPATTKLLLAVEAMKAGMESIAKGEMTIEQEVRLASEAIYARSFVQSVLNRVGRDDFDELASFDATGAIEAAASRNPLNDWTKAGESVGGLAIDFCLLADRATWREDVLEVTLPKGSVSAAVFLRRPEIAAGLSMALSEIAGRPVGHSILIGQEATHGR